MMAQKQGVIINMSSCIAEIGVARRAAYAPSKGAVLSLTKSMQTDYAQYGIRVNALLPPRLWKGTCGSISAMTRKALLPT